MISISDFVSLVSWWYHPSPASGTHNEHIRSFFFSPSLRCLTWVAAEEEGKKNEVTRRWHRMTIVYTRVAVTWRCSVNTQRLQQAPGCVPFWRPDDESVAWNEDARSSDGCRSSRRAEWLTCCQTGGRRTESSGFCIWRLSVVVFFVVDFFWRRMPALRPRLERRLKPENVAAGTQTCKIRGVGPPLRA